MQIHLFSPAFYWMESWMDPVLYWLMGFLLVILAKIVTVKRQGIRKSRDSMYFTEAIGLPLTFGQPVVFGYAVWQHDWLGMLITLWWGPGFLLVAGLVLWSKSRHISLDWRPWATVISWVCKFNYLLYLGLAVAWHMPRLAFVLSAWIASDQIEKSFAALDADRARRSLHDFWLVRLLYPAFLLSPWWTGLGPLYSLYGSLLLVIWLAGLAYVYRQGEFMNLPDDPTLLRNMRYFGKKPS